MKSSLLAFLDLSVLTLLAGCERSRALDPPKAVAVREDGALDLRLMSFNVRYETPDDRGAYAWRKRIRGAVKMIRKQGPDIIGVQEALHGQAADLWASLPDYEFFGVGREDGLRAGEYSGIFYQRDRFRLDPAEQGTFWLSDTPSNPGYLYLTGNEVSLAGNTKLWANDMTDTFQQLHPGNKNRRSLHFWKGNRDGALKVDHIMVSRGAKVREAAIVWEDDPVVSDHFPVTASVIFP